ncbi:MAG: glycosyltransferase family 2 protein, partial [Candidatus Cloacimonadota bacterium]|nr:glycosyltransferase family 2 protein [Candidatus Cloacimonadota bacterium]
GTDDIVREMQKKNPIIKLIVEKERNGKSSAINLFLKEARSNIAVIESGDTVPHNDVLEKLISPFKDESVGMTGGRPSPINTSDNFIGFSVNLLWKLHHKMALKTPKLGEMIAFRKIFDKIPSKSAVDEASIEAIMHKNNLSLKYIPDAVIFNKGPENIKEFIIQRKRIMTGHLWLESKYNYKVVSQKKSLLIKITLSEMLHRPNRIHWIFGTVFIEIYSRILGWIDFSLFKKNPFKWEIVKSTKKL